MLSKMAEKYREETGNPAWVAMNGNDSENDCEIHAYIEGPSNHYINWLEERASKNSEEAASSTSTNNASPKFSCLFCGKDAVSGLCESHTEEVLDEQEL